jgi:hypothetical protein
MRLVDDQQRSVLVAQPARGLVIARVRQHDADIGQCRLEQAGGDVFVRKCRFETLEIIDLHDPGRLVERNGFADVAAA